MSDANVILKFDELSDLCTTMETLVTQSTNLQNDLGDLKTTLTSNWVGGDADTLLVNYDAFVENIQTISDDIMSVNNWCNETASLFKATASTNAEEITNNMNGTGGN